MNEFIEKTDYYGLSTKLSTLAVLSSEDGRSNETAEATGEDGSVVAWNVYGEKIAPSNEYVMKCKDLVVTEDTGLALGLLSNIVDGQDDDGADIKRTLCLNNISISTSAGAAPSISVSGEEVDTHSDDDLVTSCQYSIAGFTLSKKHHAQILMGAFSYNGKESEVSTGVHLKSANYTFSCNITKAEKEGVCLAHDVTEGRIECQVEFIQVGETKPVLTAGDGWEVTSVLACSNPDADWPSWSGTLTKYLAKD